jgi:hypothetical protein
VDESSGGPISRWGVAVAVLTLGIGTHSQRVGESSKAKEWDGQYCTAFLVLLCVGTAACTRAAVLGGEARNNPRWIRPVAAMLQYDGML